mgnify:CR=1 FL=1
MPLCMNIAARNVHQCRARAAFRQITNFFIQIWHLGILDYNSLNALACIDNIYGKPVCIAQFAIVSLVDTKWLVWVCVDGENISFAS